MVRAEEARATHDLKRSIVEQFGNLRTNDLRAPERGSAQTAHFEEHRKLIPYFKRYAEKLLKAYIRAYIDQRWSPDDCVHFLADTVIPSVIDQMVPDKTFSYHWYWDQVLNWDRTLVFPLSGAWERTLSDCGSAIAEKAGQQDEFLKAWDSKYVRQLRLEDNANHFRRQIRSHLDPHIDDWFAEVWQGNTTQLDTSDDVPHPVETDAGAKPGRPSRISRNKKLEALEAKAEGKSNRECAKLLYDTTEPSRSQTNSVTTILKHFVNRNPRDVLQTMESKEQVVEYLRQHPRMYPQFAEHLGHSNSS